jgi:hypothetical protein
MWLCWTWSSSRNNKQFKTVHKNNLWSLFAYVNICFLDSVYFPFYYGAIQKKSMIIICLINIRFLDSVYFPFYYGVIQKQSMIIICLINIRYLDSVLFHFITVLHKHNLWSLFVYVNLRFQYFLSTVLLCCINFPKMLCFSFVDCTNICGIIQK